MGGEDSEKITRSSGDTLAIKISEDEETYRAKYLPDPKKLTDEKLVCTVCSVSLAREIHQGKTVHVHRALKVLVCEACFTFYGDGCFSADEDGDDKYCRWCGQGGTLFLCSTCNCAFCQKCVKQNLKASVLADLEKDDWKCYFCNPRPLFGCRTICWGATELNKIGMEKEKEKLKKQKERLEKMEARKKEKEEHLQKLKKLDMSSEDEQITKKRKSRVRNSDSSSSEVMPAKKTRSSEGRGHVNGNIDRSRRKRRDSSSDSDDSDNKKVTSKLRSRNKRTKKPADSSSEDEPDLRSKSRSKLKKKPSKDSSDSSDEDNKSKRKLEKKRNDSSDDESSDEKHVKKKRMIRSKKNDSESSNDHKPKKKHLRRKKKDSSAEDKSNDDRSKKQTKAKKKPQAEDLSDNSEDNSKRDRKKVSESKKRNDDSDNDSKKSKKHINDKCLVDGKAEELKLKGNDLSGDNALVRKRIKLAVLWLSSAVKDISELGTLISIRATKFGKKKINLENLKTYDDVLKAVSKLKQLMSGIHSNYEHLEKGLEAQLKPWKIMTGLEEPDKEKNIVEETNTIAKSEEVVKEVKTSETFEQSTVVEENLKKEQAKENNATDDMVLQWSGLSADEDSSEEKMATKALISKAKDTLDREDIINGETETARNDFSKEKVTDQSKKQDTTADDVSVTNPTTPSKHSTNVDDTENSESLLNQPENDLKDDSQTLVETSDKKDEKEAQDKSNISKKTDASHSGSDTDMFDSSEIISSTQVNNGEDDDCSGDESKKEKRKDTLEDASKRKSELKASVDVCLRSPKRFEHSSDNEFDLFSKKLQNKWLPEDNMNLKTSLGIDSSGDSDVECEKNKDKEKNIELKNDSCKEKTKKGNVKCSEKVIGKSKGSNEKVTPSNSESKVKDAPEEEKPVRPKRAMKVSENNKEGGKNDKTEKLERNNVLTSDEELEHEDIEKDEDKLAKKKRNKEDSTTKKQTNKSGDKKKTHKKDRHSSESDETEGNKNGQMDDSKNNGPLNKKNKEDIKKQSKKDTRESKNILSSDESEDEDMTEDSNSKTRKSKRNKKSTTNHKKDNNSSEIDDTKGNSDKVKRLKKRSSQNKKNEEEIKKQSKKEIKERKNTLSSEDSEDENIKNDSNSRNNQSKKNKKSTINHKKDKHSSESDDSEGDKQDKAKVDNLKGSVSTNNKVNTKKQRIEEAQERKNILSSEDSGDEDEKKDSNSTTHQSNKNKQSTINKTNDVNSSKSDDSKGDNINDKVKKDKEKGSHDKKTKDDVKKQSKKETQERKNTLSSDSGDEDMKKDSKSKIHQSNRKTKSTINEKKNRNSSESDDTEGGNNDKMKEGKKKSLKIKKTKDEVQKQSKKETKERKNTLSSDDSGDEEIKKESNSTIKQSNKNKKDKNLRNSSNSEDSEKDEKSTMNKKVKQSIIKEKSKNKLDESKGNDSLDESFDVDMEAKNKSNNSNTPRESSEEKEIITDSQNKSLGEQSKEKSELIEDSDVGDLANDEIQDTNLSVECVQLEDDDEICEVIVEESSKAVEDKKTKEKPVKKKSERYEKKKNLALLDSSDEEDMAANDANSSQKENSDAEDNDEAKEDSVRSASPINLSSDDSSDFEVIKKRKRKPKSSSDSEPVEVSEDEDKKSSKRRKRIKMAESSSDEASGSDDEKVKVKRKRKSSVGESPGKGGRKNIKKIKGKDDLADATKEAAEEEKERRRRVEERQKLFNQVFEVKEAHVLDKLVLDFDPKEKKELLSVNTALVSKMKPHQAKGVKFMWDSCFESLSEIKKKKGSGCILAHCMGLGKTFQVISLVHTLMTNEETGIHTVMVVCPLSTVLNWYNEFDKWLQGVEGGDDIEVFHLTKCKQNPERARELRRWQHNGGVLIMGYEMFRNLSAENKKFRAKMKKDFQETLIDPGADMIVCDEGHMLKNEQTALSKTMTKVKTLRRIILTGTPMQNNLNEYHCMVQFVKPNLLGTRKEFLNRFVNPITNGQFVDSTDSDVKVMKRRAHVLHKMLEGLVQRFDYNVLTPFLPPKHEYVVSVCLSELQIKLYQHYLQRYSQQSENNKGGARLFQDWQALGRIWTHPRVLKMSSDKANLLREKKALEESDSEGSLQDFIDDGSDAETTAESSDDNSSFASDKSDSPKKSKSHSRARVSTRSTRSNRNIALLDSSEDEKEKKEEEATEAAAANTGEWWSEFVEPNHLDDINQSGKLVLLLGILKECEMIEDKILVFSQSLFSLDLIEYFLDKIDQATQEGRLDESLGNHQGNWSKGLDYFRLDGSTSSENRSIWCSNFNREDNPRARLFLISTRAGGLGINLTAANRVIIFDASWNPSHDVQSIFRIYRFGQKKPCYVYRFIAHGTMEEKVYDRQVAKQSMSNRVVDEQQVHRHFSSNDLNELYSFTPPTNKEDREIPALPKDVLFAEILKAYSDWVEKYHEHDSLLENVIEEELNEEERKLAWEDYENDKKRGFAPSNTGNVGMSNTMSYQIEYLRQQLKVQYPHKSEQELNQILVYQVSLLMRQQQMKTQMQQPGLNMGMAGNMGMQMGQGSLMAYANQMQQQGIPQAQQQQMYAEYQKKLQQANMARLQLQQLQYQQQQQQQQQQSVLRSQLTQPAQQSGSVAPSLPQSRAIEMMLQNYQAPRAQGPQDTSKSKPSKPPS